MRRYRCEACEHDWRQDTSKAAEPRATLSRAGLRWALEAIVCQHLTVARVAEALGVSWNTANTAVLDEGLLAVVQDVDDGVVRDADVGGVERPRRGPEFGHAFGIQLGARL